MKTVLISGGTGLIGRALTKALLDKDYKVIILSRQTSNRKPETGNLSHAQWNIRDQTIDTDAVCKSDYIIHLAGAGVADKRWSKKRKQEIIDSRVRSGELIVSTLRDNRNQVKAVISSSGIGWYGPDPSIPNPHPFVETDPAYNDFLGQTCEKWEGSLKPIVGLGKRLVVLRTGIVLSREGGALKEFIKPLRFGVAAILGSGKQMISWIHVDDLVNLYIQAIENETFDGVYNAVTPLAVSNKRLTLQLAKTIRGNFYVPLHIPSSFLKLALGEMSVEVLKSATVSCDKVLVKGFHFSFPSIENALEDLKKLQS
jgi:uncharacterized protein (TIGR01777 family)